MFLLQIWSWPSYECDWFSSVVGTETSKVTSAKDVRRNAGHGVRSFATGNVLTRPIIFSRAGFDFRKIFEGDSGIIDLKCH